ncbi:MAG: hypothetical protein ACI4AD_10705 [Roseburia sp.]
MKKKIGIWTLAGLAFAVAFAVRMAGSGPKIQENKNEDFVSVQETEQVTEIPAAESMAVKQPYAYVIGIQDGKLVVYHSDGTTVFFETGIRTSDLGQELIDRISKGVYFTDEAGLYEFLENCSS